MENVRRGVAVFVAGIECVIVGCGDSDGVAGNDSVTVTSGEDGGVSGNDSDGDGNGVSGNDSVTVASGDDGGVSAMDSVTVASCEIDGSGSVTLDGSLSENGWYSSAVISSDSSRSTIRIGSFGKHSCGKRQIESNVNDTIPDPQTNFKATKVLTSHARIRSITPEKMIGAETVSAAEIERLRAPDRTLTFTVREAV
jgi:hypothetical protein